MAENNDFVEKENCKITAVCGECRHHQRNPTLEFNFGDSKVYWLCQSCKKMNTMDFSKTFNKPYPKPRRM